MLVMKFGGTSVATAKNIKQVSQVIQSKKTPVAVVVSAFGGVTNDLEKCAFQASSGDEDYSKTLAAIEKRHLSMAKDLISVKNQSKTLSKIKILLNELEDIYRGVFLIRETTLKTQDRILSFGEILSSTIIADFLTDQKQKVRLIEVEELVKTDSNFGRAHVHFDATNANIKKLFTEDAIYLCPGFVATNAKGEITTLGRGGSDYTASLLAAALNSPTLEIWTDVSGMMTADPRIVKSAYAIPRVSYDEAMELSHFGAKVIYPPTIHPVLEKGIPLHVKNTFAPEDAGTIIGEPVDGPGQLIKGLSCIQNIALFSLTGSGMVGIPSFSHRLFRALSAAKVNVILITQASSEHSICVGIDRNDLDRAKDAVSEEFMMELQAHMIDPIDVEEDLSIIALVGNRMKEQVGVSGRMFSVLGQNGVNIKAIAQGSSEKNISVVIRANQVKKALNSLHESFFLSERKVVNLFMVGVGNVGGTLISQLSKQYRYLLKHHHIELRVVALANSRKMIFDESGLDMKTWKEDLEQGEKMKLDSFVDKMIECNLRNSIFIDNTAEESLALSYENILRKSINVVTPNKIACTQDMQHYRELKFIASQFRTKFLFETNVGAGLPVINTLNDLIKSGDEVHKIEAVLSGSLNFIFNNFTKATHFADIVKQAQEEGYTEPDPRIDLSGVDVMRKILILIRESNYEMELDAIKSKPFIPEECMQAADVEAFFESLEKYEDHFQELLVTAEKKKAKIKYVASFNNGKATAGLQFIEAGHPFYNLEGKDNIVLFTTRRYPEQPLVIKGAGAGADVTAMGIFGDIMRIAHG